MTERVRADLQITGDRLTIAEIRSFAAAAERAGLGGVWVAEGFYDSLVLATIAADATDRIPIGTNVTQWVRTPAAMELASSSIDDASGGRFTLGLGTAIQSWNEKWHGIAWERPVRRMREYIEALRALWEASPDRPVTYRGDFFAIDDYVRLAGPAARRLPVYIGSMKPMMTRLAGALADGVIYNLGCSAEFVRDRLEPELAAGEARSGRTVERGVIVIAAVADDYGDALLRAKHQVAYYAGVGNFCDDTFEHHGWSRELAAVKAGFEERRPADGDVRAAFADESFRPADLISDEIAQAIALVATPSTLRSQMARYDGVVDFATLTTPSFRLTAEEIRDNHRAIIDALRT